MQHECFHLKSIKAQGPISMAQEKKPLDKENKGTCLRYVVFKGNPSQAKEKASTCRGTGGYNPTTPRAHPVNETKKELAHYIVASA